MKLNVRAFALAFGIWWGAGIFLLAWWIMAVGGQVDGPTFLERVYIGYAYTPLGSVIGLVWGFVDGLVGGAIFAWLYNLLQTRFFSEGQQEARVSG